MIKNLDYYLNLNYEIKAKILRKEEGGGWLIEIPDLLGCVAIGDTLEAALENLQSAKKQWVETRMLFGRTIPEPKYSPEDRVFV